MHGSGTQGHTQMSAGGQNALLRGRVGGCTWVACTEEMDGRWIEAWDAGDALCGRDGGFGGVVSGVMITSLPALLGGRIRAGAAGAKGSKRKTRISGPTALGVSGHVGARLFDAQDEFAHGVFSQLLMPCLHSAFAVEAVGDSEVLEMQLPVVL